VVPYFRRTERRIGFGDDEIRGRDGSLPVTDMDWINPVSEAKRRPCIGPTIPGKDVRLGSKLRHSGTL
jgi:choline dehydrogenase